MEDIRKVEDLIQFILQADEIECDGSSGADIIVPIHAISLRELNQECQALEDGKMGKRTSAV